VKKERKSEIPVSVLRSEQFAEAMLLHFNTFDVIDVEAIQLIIIDTLITYNYTG